MCDIFVRFYMDYALYVQKKVQISFYLCMLTIKSLYTCKKRLFSLLCLLGAVSGLLPVIRLICSLISLMTVGTVFIWLIVWMG